jgi:hypothetical protein
MEEQNKNDHGANCSCEKCADGKNCCGKCFGWNKMACWGKGGACGGGRHCWWLIRVVIMAIIIVTAFAIGFKLGELKGYLGGYGSDGYGRHGMVRGRGCPMMGDRYGQKGLPPYDYSQDSRWSAGTSTGR